MLIAAAGLGFLMMWNSVRTFRDDVDRQYRNAVQVLSVQADFKKQVQEWKDTLLRGSNPADLDKYWGQFEKQESLVRNGMTELLKTVDDAESRALVEHFLAAHQKMGWDYRKGLNAFKDSGFASSAGDAAVKGMDRAPSELLSQAAQRLKTLAAESSHQAEARSRQGIVWSVGAMAVACAFGTIITLVFIRKEVLLPIAQLELDLGNLANLDLATAFTQKGSDELGMIAASAEKVRRNMQDMMAQLLRSADEVSSAALQLRESSDVIATATEKIASQAQTVATAGEEMTATSQGIAENCQQAAQEAHLATTSAQSGAVIVDTTIVSMTNIATKVQESAKTVESLGSRSKQIGEISSTIEEIADQTNLLALNAAIEAARAGEQGRGFAVVADEVRALAERTSRATREITQMIAMIQAETNGAVAVMEAGVDQVSSGTTEAARSGEALQTILQQIDSLNLQVSQIATAAEEQTATTTEISLNIQQINDVVSTAAQNAHESAQAAALLSSNAERLHTLVQRFRI
ncbi:methyl-accepting chemotaxis protein [Geomonas sp. Red875]|uniref:Methyl-accepting chemotaxis protein n=2 Tax=Geomesophilobacter sediminis TaxID=2798584 RepID=A0A8J7S6X6_9BACT|nr:methyl-accepting chemotaxis protein [Geomesophilobacter sediminis]